MHRFFSRAYLLFLILILTFLSCRRSNEFYHENIVNINISADVQTLDPAISYDLVSGTILNQTYETLLQYHYLKRPYTLEPLLAEEMPSISEDGKTITIKIKKGVKFHDSLGLPARTLKSQDFITQFKRIAFKPTKSNGWFLFKNKIVGLDAFRKLAKNDFKKFKSLAVEGLIPYDDHTLVIKLKNPYPQFLNVLAMNFTAPVPIEAVEKFSNNLSNIEVGTGAFYLKDYNPSSNIELKKFKNYHEQFYPSEGDRYSNSNNLLKDAGKKLPLLDGAKFHIIKEDQPRWLQFLNKKIDLLRIPKDNFANAVKAGGEISKELKDKGIALQIAPSLTYWWISFNMKDSIVGKSKNLRLAIAHAIDIDRYISLFTNNTGQKAFSIFPPGIPGYTASSKIMNSYDLDRARDYLKKAGYENGNGLPIINYDVRGSDSTKRQAGEFIKTQLEKIGIRVNVVTNTFPGFLKKKRTGKLQMWLGGWAMDYPDAENTLQLLHSKNHPPGPNGTQFSNKEFDQLFDELKILPNDQPKFDIMNKMEAIVHQNTPWVMLYYRREYRLFYTYLKNYRYSPISGNFLKYLRIVGKK